MRAAAAVLALLLYAPLAAQELPRIQAGGVATMVVRVSEGAEGADSVTYRIVPAEGVRLFGAEAGRVAATDGGPAFIPVTAGLPPQATAGVFAFAEVFLSWQGGRSERRVLSVEVLPRRGASFWIGNESLTAAVGTTAELPYGVRNLGNAPDTFRIRVAGPSAWASEGRTADFVLGPGEQASGVFSTNPPNTASSGEQYVVRASLEATGVQESRSALLTVVSPTGAVGGLTTIPGSIFVGSSTGRDELTPDVALQAGGEVAPGVRLNMELRHSEQLSPVRAFRSVMPGPRVRVGLTTARWSARAGEIFAYPDLVTGPAMQGLGFDASYASGPIGGDLFLARPTSYGGSLEDGHVARVSARYRTDYGLVGFSASSVALDGGFLPSLRQGGGVLTYALRTNIHEVEAEAGVVAVATDSVSRTGGAAELRYALNTGPVSLAARLRRVPGTTARTASHGNESFLSGSYQLTDAVSFMASGYSTDGQRVDGGAYGTSAGAAMGLRLSLPRGVSGAVTGAYRTSDLVGSGLQPTETRLVSLRAGVPLGRFMIEADADVGVTEGYLGSGRYGSGRLGARWGGEDQWGWAGVTHTDFGFGQPETRVDFSGSLRFREIDIEAGLNARLDAEFGRSASFWSGVTAPVLHNTSISAGLEYRGYWTSSPWRLSLGVRRTFGMPLPLPRKPALHGVIFQDLDADGVRDQGEPPLPGVGVQLGALRGTTDADGTFRFFDRVAGELRVTSSDLPMGVILADGTTLPVRGEAAIPVVRTASIDIRAFLDRDRDDFQDGGEDQAVGALVTLVDAMGASRDAVTDASGRTRFNGLRPGHYRLRVSRPEAGAVPVEVNVVLHPGAEERLVVAVPFRSREIRLPGGGALEPGFPGPLSASGQTATVAEPIRATPADVPPTGSEPTQAAGEGESGAVNNRAPNRPPAVRLVAAARADVASPVDQDSVADRQGAGDPAEEVPARSQGSLLGLLVAAILATPGVVAVGLYDAQRRRAEQDELA